MSERANFHGNKMKKKLSEVNRNNNAKRAVLMQIYTKLNIDEHKTNVNCFAQTEQRFLHAVLASSLFVFSSTPINTFYGAVILLSNSN